MIDFNSYTVVDLRQWIKEYQEKNNTSFTGLSKMRKAELYKLAVTLNNSIKDETPITGPVPFVDTSAVLTPENVDMINKEIEEIIAIETGDPNPIKTPTSKAHNPEIETIYNSLNRKQKRKFNKLCKGAIVLDDTEVTWERLASCF